MLPVRHGELHSSIKFVGNHGDYMGVAVDVLLEGQEQRSSTKTNRNKP